MYKSSYCYTQVVSWTLFPNEVKPLLHHSYEKYVKPSYKLLKGINMNKVTFNRALIVNLVSHVKIPSKFHCQFQNSQSEYQNFIVNAKIFKGSMSNTKLKKKKKKNLVYQGPP